MAEGMCGKGRCAWQGWVSVVREACVAGGVHGMGWVSVVREACMAGGVRGSASWGDARTACQSEGGDLTVMETEELWNYVKSGIFR